MLGSPPASFESPGLARLRRDLERIIAFADATRRTGRVLGEIAVAPGDRPERVLARARVMEVHGGAYPSTERPD